MAAATRVVALSLVQRASAAALDHRLRAVEVVNVSMAASTLGQAVPGGGATAGAVAVQRLTRFGVAGPVATTIFALAAASAAASIALIGTVGVLAAMARGEIAPGYVLAAAGVVVMALVMGAVVLVGFVVNQLAAAIPITPGGMDRGLGGSRPVYPCSATAAASTSSRSL